jgi:hypothetical protein
VSTSLNHSSPSNLVSNIRAEPNAQPHRSPDYRSGNTITNYLNELFERDPLNQSGDRKVAKRNALLYGDNYEVQCEHPDDETATLKIRRRAQLRLE